MVLILEIKYIYIKLILIYFKVKYYFRKYYASQLQTPSYYNIFMQKIVFFLRKSIENTNKTTKGSDRPIENCLRLRRTKKIKYFCRLY